MTATLHDRPPAPAGRVSNARPRFMTPRTPSRATRGPEVVRAMRMLGWEPHPWQEEALDVLYEVDDAGRQVYSSGVILLPRRGGKTTIGLSAIVHRAHAYPGPTYPPQRSMSNMQTGIDSRNMFTDTWLPRLEASPFAGTYTEVRQVSHEQIRWHNGAVHSIRAPKVGGGVGSDLDLWLNDEAWHLEDTSLEGAILPTMGTRADALALHLSMAGDDNSGFLKAKRDAGRALVEIGANTGVFYLEFSAPEDADPLDEEVWWATHPALGRTLSIDRLRSFAQSMELEDFAKEFLGIWPTGKAEAVFDLEQWAIGRLDAGSRIEGPIALAIDVNPDRDRASIAAAGARDDGLAHIEVVRNDRGTDWIIEHVKRVDAKLPAGSRWAIDGRSAAATLQPELEAAGITPVVFGAFDAVKSAGTFYDYVVDDRLRHLGQPSLTDAVAGAARRKIGSVWGWRRTPGVDATPLVAASQALWLHLQAPPAQATEYGWRPWDLQEKES